MEPRIQSTALFRIGIGTEMKRCRRSIAAARPTPHRIGKLLLLFAIQCPAIALFSVDYAEAQHIPVVRYDVSEGLASSKVQAIHQSSMGYIWIATQEGLSRFDGYGFRNYGLADGLPAAFLNSIAEDRRGRIWIGTNGGGVARLEDHPAQATTLEGASAVKFKVFAVSNDSYSNRVNATLFDSTGALWCVTDHGLYRAVPDSNDIPRFEFIADYAPSAQNMAAFSDRDGHLWFGVRDALFEVIDGKVITHAPPKKSYSEITGIVRDTKGRLLIAFGVNGVFEFVGGTDRSGSQWKQFLEPGRYQKVYNPMIDSRGRLWIASREGLIKYSQDDLPELYTTANGLSCNWVSMMVEDHEGNLWVGTQGGGVCELMGESIVSYTAAEGFAGTNVEKVIEGVEGRIYASVSGVGAVQIAGSRIEAVPSPKPQVDGGSYLMLQDRRSDWWVGTAEGLFLINGPRLQLRHYTKVAGANGLAEGPVLRLDEQAAGVVSVRIGDDFYTWDPRISKRVFFERLSSSFRFVFYDSSGALWVLTQGEPQIQRLASGTVTTMDLNDGLPSARMRVFFQDSRGWLWIGLSSNGVSMTRDPAADHPAFVNYSTRDGLSSDVVSSIAEDDNGLIYLGTGKGLDQLDPATGVVRHFNGADGLAGNHVNYCMKDSRGNIWVATPTGISRFAPRLAATAVTPPHVFLSGFSVAGEDQMLPENGSEQFGPLTLVASQNNVLVEYVAISFKSKQRLRYQYKLEGMDREWSPPSEQRSVNYAHLAPGSYRFLVRAINQEQTLSPEPAVLQFTILSPIWRRWWFLTLIALTVMLATYCLYRYRVARLVELERIRSRIAADLHDDIGSNLSLIAMASEVAQHQVRSSDSQVSESLSLISGTARELVDSMSDIVWAVNPNRDRLSDLTHRMRRFADDILSARGIGFVFPEPDGEQSRLGASVRREVFLIFKEAVNNIVRHSECTETTIDFHVERGWLVLELQDNGRGFDPAHPSEGNGLMSMQKRAASLGGILEVISSDGRGVAIILRVPLSRQP